MKPVVDFSLDSQFRIMFIFPFIDKFGGLTLFNIDNLFSWVPISQIDFSCSTRVHGDFYFLCVALIRFAHCPLLYSQLSSSSSLVSRRCSGTIIQFYASFLGLEVYKCHNKLIPFKVQKLHEPLKMLNLLCRYGFENYKTY